MNLRVRYLPVLAALIAAACSGKRPAVEAMHPGDATDASGSVFLTFTTSAAYCEGADIGISRYPDQAMARATFHYRVGAVNDSLVPAVPFTTDDLGHVRLTLPVGSYGIIDRDRLDGVRYHRLLRDHAKARLHQAAVDTACLRRWWATPHVIFTIAPGAEDTVHVRFDEPCPWYATPCVSYSGSAPP